MGVSLDRIEELFSLGIINSTKPSVLDIGCSNLHSGSIERFKKFIIERNPGADGQELDRWCKFAAIGGTMDPEIGGINGLFLGDFLNRAGINYHSFDIFSGYKTEIFDLNHQQLDGAHSGKYDVVLNFGTTEHLLGQFNAFKVIHEATATGGIIYHDLPMTGYLDHGYFCYNPMLFTQLAEANGYEVIRLAFSGSLGAEEIEASLASKYRNFPFFNISNGSESWLKHKLPTASVSAIFRKVSDAPFRASLETSTTVGGVTDDIESQYGGDAAAINARNHAASLVDSLLRRGADGSLSLDEVMEGYYATLATGPNATFPSTLERRALQFVIASNPSDSSAKTRLAEVEEIRARKYPLLKNVLNHEVFSENLKFDGIEDNFEMPTEDSEIVAKISAAYRSYLDNSSIELFPPYLEAAALEVLQRQNPADKLLLSRLGNVIEVMLPKLP